MTIRCFAQQLFAGTTAWRRGARQLLTVVGIVACLGVGEAAATDYSHLCRSADGFFVMNDEELKTGEAERAAKLQSIKYRVLQTVVLGLREGYCLDTKRADARGKRFGFQSKTYVQRIAFTHQGRKHEIDMLCELVSDGMPAAYSCGREIVTKTWRIVPRNPATPEKSQTPRSDGPPATVPPGGRSLPDGGSRWLFNGSVVRLYADGNRRRILYDLPKDGLARRGIVQGSVMFEGRRNGSVYEGQAYSYPLGCKPAAYLVEGRVSRDERSVVLEGFAPTYSSRCLRSGLRRQRLVIELMR